jgi:hypothetical protein
MQRQPSALAAPSTIADRSRLGTMCHPAVAVPPVPILVAVEGGVDPRHSSRGRIMRLMNASARASSSNSSGVTSRAWSAASRCGSRSPLLAVLTMTGTARAAARFF